MRKHNGVVLSRKSYGNNIEKEMSSYAHGVAIIFQVHVGLGHWVKQRIKGKGAVDRVGWNNKGGVRGELTDRVEVEGKVSDVGSGDRVAIDSRDLTLRLDPNLSTDSFLNKEVKKCSL